ncbi:MAG: 6,7-dimethyl-8-ribityllumazine synthase [Marinicaulis sp.]|nr:6,7-dimethyl-8-ribityllumazine synthase [Marinicaulis sp.]NNL89259.1 6,7-dimethyl-8-ribityllumazine synthase [Marinicaulis sp.]
MAQEFTGSMNGAGLRLAIVATRWNEMVVDKLVSGARGALARCGVEENAIDLATAPGAYEVPFIARKLAATGRYHGVVALGCVIRGATPHFDYVAGEAATGLATAARDTGVPISFGVLTVDTIEQAIERAGTKAGNKGEEAALACLETINLCRSIEEA